MKGHLCSRAAGAEPSASKHQVIHQPRLTRWWFPCLLGLLLLLSGFSAGSAAAVEIAGQTLTTDTTWTAAGGPYEVTGTVTVASGVELEIEPGAELAFAAGASLTIQGRLDRLPQRGWRSGSQRPQRRQRPLSAQRLCALIQTAQHLRPIARHQLAAAAE